MIRRSKLLFAAGASFICVWFLWFARAGVRSYFSPDDMMNLFGWWIEPAWKLAAANAAWFTGAYRPLGGAFYRVLFAIFGFHPLPFRLACFALLLVNLFLAYSAARRLSGSREAAALTVLIFSYHSYLWDIYLSTGVVYDILCFTFYFAALLYYVKLRQTGQSLGPWQLAALAALQICALNSKEMAVTLPAALAVYEWIYQRPRQWRGAAVTAAIAAPALIVRLVTGPMAGNPAYTPAFTREMFFGTWANYLEQLSHEAHRFQPAEIVLVWALLLVMAWRIGRTALKFATAFILVSMMPIAFVPRRAGFVQYIPYFGWSLYVSVLLLAARDAMARRVAVLSGTPARVMLFLAAAASLVPLNLHSAPDSHWPRDEQNRVRAVVEPMHRLHPTLRRGARVLFQDDFLPPEEHLMLWAVRLSYGDNTIQVDRAKTIATTPDPHAYDYVFTYKGFELIEVK